MNGTDPRSTQKTNMKGHPDSPLSSNTCKHPSIHPSSYSNSSPSQSIGDGQKGSAFILEYLKDSQTAFSDEPTDTPVHRVFDIDVPLWEWYELSEQSYRRRRFGVAMHGIGSMRTPEVLTNGEFVSVDKGVRVLTVCKTLEWGSLPEGPKVVDVGGGVGTSSLRIARAFSNVK